MRQKYYCPNCGAPVVCGERFCIGCGINFKWIAQPESAQAAPISYKLPRPDQQGISTQERLQLDEHTSASARAEPDRTAIANRKSAQSGGGATPLSAEVSKLLESLFDKHARCNRA